MNNIIFCLSKIYSIVIQRIKKKLLRVLNKEIIKYNIKLLMCSASIFVYKFKGVQFKLDTIMSAIYKAQRPKILITLLSKLMGNMDEPVQGNI